jgi:hypothetical protein
MIVQAIIKSKSIAIDTFSIPKIFYETLDKPVQKYEVTVEVPALDLHPSVPTFDTHVSFEFTSLMINIFFAGTERQN